MDDLVSELESADPAQAPPIADRIADALSGHLEEEDGDDAAPQA